MRVKLDENLPIEFKRLFAESGCDAATVLDEGLGGASDDVLASACTAEQRALITQDVDFSDVRTYPPAEYPGIVVLRLSNPARDSILEVGSFLVERMRESSPDGQLWIVEDSRIRIRA